MGDEERVKGNAQGTRRVELSAADDSSGESCGSGLRQVPRQRQTECLAHPAETLETSEGTDARPRRAGKGIIKPDTSMAIYSWLQRG